MDGVVTSDAKGFVAFASTRCFGRCIAFSEELEIIVWNGCNGNPSTIQWETIFCWRVPVNNLGSKVCTGGWCGNYHTTLILRLQQSLEWHADWNWCFCIFDIGLENCVSESTSYYSIRFWYIGMSTYSQNRYGMGVSKYDIPFRGEFSKNKRIGKWGTSNHTNSYARGDVKPDLGG